MVADLDEVETGRLGPHRLPNQFRGSERLCRQLVSDLHRNLLLSPTVPSGYLLHPRCYPALGSANGTELSVTGSYTYFVSGDIEKDCDGAVTRYTRNHPGAEAIDKHSSTPTSSVHLDRYPHRARHLERLAHPPRTGTRSPPAEFV
ncbi:hypothetical protein NWFMUON74_33450 [Nocardia wallacei]|uniref:Uncharacterized protein n=1 Tax=Nocardia wallacei TaxID=480035 RepID=A0A7G1KMX1_9NOCA|nr:hypothetical protein NWFMUON74_33450 [Nocardia wallacei]